MKNVLIACEESQRVCLAFRRRGFNAFSCDTSPCSGGAPEYHIQADVLSVIYGNGYFVTEDNISHKVEKWDLIIAHPPCTYLTKAGACRMYRVINGKRYIDSERYESMKDARRFFFQLYNAPANHVAIENPVPLKICELPDASQSIQPYEYGEPYSKKTLLWLYGLPQLKPTKILDNHEPYLPSNTSNFSKGKGGSYGLARSQRERSKTFPGIAEAMAEQWGNFLLSEGFQNDSTS